MHAPTCTPQRTTNAPQAPKAPGLNDNAVAFVSSTPVLPTRGGDDTTPPPAGDDPIAGRVDWYEATYPAAYTAGDVIDRLTLAHPWIREPHGTRWYATVWRAGAVTLATDHRRGAGGPHLAVSGHATAQIDDWPALLSHPASPTRLDVYLDDHDGQLDIDHLTELARARSYVSLAGARTVRSIWESASSGAPPGRTLYLGSRSSSRMLRIYDKAAEQRVAGPWTRTELQTRDDYAAIMRAALLAGDPEQAVRDAIGAVVDFRDPYDGAYGSRAPLHAPWHEWLGHTHPVDRLPRHTTDIDRAADWLLTQVAPTLALVYEARVRTHGQDGAADWLIELLQHGQRRLPDTPRARLLPDQTPDAWTADRQYDERDSDTR